MRTLEDAAEQSTEIKVINAGNYKLFGQSFDFFVENLTGQQFDSTFLLMLS